MTPSTERSSKDVSVRSQPPSTGTVEFLQELQAAKKKADPSTNAKAKDPSVGRIPETDSESATGTVYSEVKPKTLPTPPMKPNSDENKQDNIDNRLRFPRYDPSSIQDFCDRLGILLIVADQHSYSEKLMKLQDQT